MLIREAVATDIEKISQIIIPLVDKYILPTCTEQGGLILRASMSAQQIKMYFEQGYQYSVGIQDGEIIGVIAIREHAHLYHLFVADSHQGLGYAKELWEAAKYSCISYHATQKFTVNAALNAAPIYKKWGFEALSGVRERSGIKDIPMQLLI